MQITDIYLLENGHQISALDLLPNRSQNVLAEYTTAGAVS